MSGRLNTAAATRRFRVFTPALTTSRGNTTTARESLLRFVSLVAPSAGIDV
jgi:hypothetical protein